jgi:hypothetical protein
MAMPAVIQGGFARARGFFLSRTICIAGKRQAIMRNRTACVGKLFVVTSEVNPGERQEVDEIL